MEHVRVLLILVFGGGGRMLQSRLVKAAFVVMLKKIDVFDGNGSKDSPKD